MWLRRFCRRDVADVDAVELDRAGIRVVETRHQIGQRRLARARGADQRHRFAGRDVERDAGQRRRGLAGIGERHVAQRQPPFGAGEGAAAAVALGVFVEHGEDGLGGGQPALQLVVDRGEPFQRREQQQHGHEEGDEAAHRGGVVARLVGGDVDDDGERNRGDQLDHGFVHRVGGDALHLEQPRQIGGLAEARLLVFLAAIQLDHAMPAHRLVDHLGDFADVLLRLARQAAQALAGDAHHPQRERHQREHDQGQLPVQPQQIAEQSQHRHRVAHQRGERTGGRLRHLGDVERQLRDQLAARVLVEVARRQRHQLVEHGGAQIHHQAAAHPGHAVGADEAGDAAHQEQRQQQNRHPADEGLILGDEALVQQRLEQRGQRRFGGGGEDQRDDGQREHAPVGLHIAEQADVQLMAVVGRRHGSSRVANPGKVKKPVLSGMAASRTDAPMAGFALHAFLNQVLRRVFGVFGHGADIEKPRDCNAPRFAGVDSVGMGPSVRGS